MKRRQFLLTTGLTFATLRIGQTYAGDIAQNSTPSSFFVEHDGARIYVECEGTGTPVLLLHGGLGHMGWFSELRSHLSQQYQVVLLKLYEQAYAMHYDRLNPDRDFERLLQLSIAMWKDDGIDGHPGNRVDNIRVPFLIVVGDRDPFMSVAHCAELRQRVTSSELLVIPNGTHPAYRERPDLFIPALERFLNKNKY